MSQPETITGIREIAERYDAMLCDAWGVIHNGVRLFRGVSEALTRFRAERGPVVIITNAPRPSTIIPGQLDALGLPRGAWDAIITSGDATRHEISRLLPAPAYRIGPDRDDALFGGMDIDFAPLERAQFIICTGLNDEYRETPDVYRSVLRDGADRGLVMICANPDVVVNWGGRLLWCAGALAEIYKEYGGKVVYGGKPHRPIYDLSLAAIEKARGDRPPAGRVLAIGDGLKTDILGANAIGADALFISGKGGVNDIDMDDAAEQLSKAGVRAVAVAEALRW